MDFGQVCLRSVSSEDLMIVNNLDIFIHVVVQVSICFQYLQTTYTLYLSEVKFKFLLYDSSLCFFFLQWP